MSKRSRLVVRPRIERLDQRCVLTTLSPTQLSMAYGLNAISFSNGSIKGTGEGQTIAIVDAYNDPTIVSDLAIFNANNNLPNLTTTSAPVTNSPTSSALGSFSVVNLAGSATDSGWAQEVALDVEWAHAVAPKANIVLIEAASANIPDLVAAVKQAKTISSVSVISMSWGSSEFSSESSYDSVFTTPAGHQGITFVSSSGDNGAGAEWPSSSPNVVSVGGTSLTVNSSGARSNETAWTGSGGGYSKYEPEPAYQKAAQFSGRRSSPDVALVADPNTGVMEVSGGQSSQVGGTSLSCPLFGALVAITNQGLAIAGKGTLDGATQLLPSLYSASSNDFHDITSGANVRSLPGYDTSTGLGTPVANLLTPYLISKGTATTPPPGGGTNPTPTPVSAPKPTPPATPAPPPHRWQPPFWWFFGSSGSSWTSKMINTSGAPSNRPFWF